MSKSSMSICLSDLAGMCYALTIPQSYYCWDIIATAYLAPPHLYRVVEQETDIITMGISQGRTIIKPRDKKIRIM